MQSKRGVRIHIKPPFADTKVCEEGWGFGAASTRAEIFLQTVVNIMVRQAILMQPVNVNGGANIYLQPGEDLALEQEDVPKRCCDPVVSPHWRRLLA